MKALFIGIILLFSIQSFGQLEKKVWLIGGSGAFSKYTDKVKYLPNDYGFTTGKDIETLAEFSALIGYFPINKFATGFRTSGRIVSAHGSGRTNALIVRAGPFVRYYFLPEEREFNLLVESSYQFGYLNHRLVHKKGRSNVFELMAGSEVFFNSSAGMEILVGYAYNDNSLDNYKQKGFRTSIGFIFHLIRD